MVYVANIPFLVVYNEINHCLMSWASQLDIQHWILRMLKTIQSKGLLYKTANCNIFKQVVANAYHSQKLVNIVWAICQMRCHKYDLSNKKKNTKMFWLNVTSTNFWLWTLDGMAIETK